MDFYGDLIDKISRLLKGGIGSLQDIYENIFVSFINGNKQSEYSLIHKNQIKQ
jgi:hypothetical protein